MPNIEYATELLCPSCGKWFNLTEASLAFAADAKRTCPHCNFELKSGQEGLEEQVIAMLRAKATLRAIKLYQSATQVGLEKSKEAVNAIAKANGIELKKGCFVATACYGSPDAPEVVMLRGYRDDVLANKLLGRTFIRFYYAVSPSLARALERSESARKLVREQVLRPLVRWLAKRS